MSSIAQQRTGNSYPFCRLPSAFCLIFKLGLIRVLEVGGAIALTGCLTVAFSGNPAVAQITPDATLGTESSVLTPNVNIRGLPGDRIDGGAVRGANLFHSFQEFNVGDAQRVYFANPTGIENILSRITGNNLSNILGILGVDGGANLFLLNPNGIIFGAGAKLDISGSFFASTANSVIFNDGYQFSAKNPETPPLLTVNVPLGVQYGTNQPQTTITNSGNLAVGQNLTLDAGHLDLQGQIQAGNNLTLQAQDTVKIRDSVTHPFVAAAGGQLLVQGSQIVDIFALNHPNSGLYSGGDMVLRSPDAVMGDAHYWSGGNFRIEQLDGSLGNLESPNDPIIRASGDVNFASYTGASLHILAGGSVNIPGTITIDTTDTIGDTINPTTTPDLANVTLSDNTTPLTIDGSAQPTLDIRAGMNTALIGVPEITDDQPPFGVFVPRPNTNLPATSANITIGNIDVTAPNGLVLLTNQYQPNLALPGGNIQLGIINARSNTGNGGSVFIDSRNGITIGPGFISTRSFAGKSGDIAIIAQNAVYLGGNNAYITSATVQGGVSNAGNITINAGSLFVDGGSFINANTFGTGDAGNIDINVRDLVSLRQTNYGGNLTVIESKVASGAVGNGGNINIRAGSLLIEGAAGLQTHTQPNGRGNAGNVFVQVDDSVSFIDGGLIYSAVEPGGQGSAGTIEIFAPNAVTISGVNPESGFSSGLFTNTGVLTSGQAGSISVNTGVLRVQNGAVVDASTSNGSDGGNVTISANRLELTGGGQLLSVTRDGGNAGNVNLNIADTVTISGSDPNFLSRLTQFGRNVVTNEDAASGIYTDASVGSTGNSGNLSMSTRQLTVSDGGQILTSSFGTGDAGELSIAATDSINVVNPNSRIITSSFGSTGNGGKLSISTNQLNVSEAAEVSTNSFGAGKAGDLLINVTDLMNVSNQGLVSTGSSDSGNGGKLSISTRQLDVKDGGQITTASTGTGIAGDLSITATDSINIVNGSYLGASPLERGTAGNTLIETAKLSIRNGSAISSSTLGAGDAGDITIRAIDSIEVVNSSKLSADTLGSGNGGNLNIETNTLSIQDSEVSTGTLRGSSGQGGTLNLSADDTVEISGVGGLVTATLGQGKGGDIQLWANSLSLTNGGSITSLSDGQDKAGNITVNLRGNLRSSGGNISASSLSAGGGDINITADDTRLRGSSLISTSVFDSTGGGGNITINSTVFLAIEDSDILANAQAGPGGNITINSSAFIADLFSSGAAVAVGRNPGDFTQFRGNGRNDISVSLAASSRNNNRVNISADSGSGLDGTVSYFYIDPTRRVAPLPNNLVDASELIDRRCTPNSNAKESSFTITGRGGLPPSPNDPLTNQEVWVDWITSKDRAGNHKNSAATSANSTRSHSQQLVEAQGWVINDQGQVVLTAQALSVTPNRSELALPSCEQVE
ncbi:MAG: filamentous hemagglutinin N-terminal domain-containing protein [Cyanobacteriota bacterium]